METLSIAMQTYPRYFKSCSVFLNSPSSSSSWLWTPNSHCHWVMLTLTVTPIGQWQWHQLVGWSNQRMEIQTALPLSYCPPDHDCAKLSTHPLVNTQTWTNPQFQWENLLFASICHLWLSPKSSTSAHSVGVRFTPAHTCGRLQSHFHGLKTLLFIGQPPTYQQTIYQPKIMFEIEKRKVCNVVKRGDKYRWEKTYT